METLFMVLANVGRYALHHDSCDNYYVTYCLTHAVSLSLRPSVCLSVRPATTVPV